MARYQVRVIEEVEYLVPVEVDGDFDEDAIKEAAVEEVRDAYDRDKWAVAVRERHATEYVGRIE